jgi:hypothetical protein
MKGSTPFSAPQQLRHRWRLRCSTRRLQCECGSVEKTPLTIYISWKSPEPLDHAVSSSVWFLKETLKLNFIPTQRRKNPYATVFFNQPPMNGPSHHPTAQLPPPKPRPEALNPNIHSFADPLSPAMLLPAATSLPFPRRGPRISGGHAVLLLLEITVGASPPAFCRHPSLLFATSRPLLWDLDPASDVA